jgi:hypothetical protein
MWAALAGALPYSPVLAFVRRNLSSVRNCTDLRLRAIAICQNETGRTHAQTTLNPILLVVSLSGRVVCCISVFRAQDVT